MVNNHPTKQTYNLNKLKTINIDINIDIVSMFLSNELKIMQISITTENNNPQAPVLITDRIKTLEDACDVLGIKGDIFVGNLNDVLGSEKIIAFIKLAIIVQALNEGWTLDWNNSDKYKYFPYWNMGGGFSLRGVGCHFQFTSVPSCLCFKNEQLAYYAAKQFFDLYQSYMTT